MRSRPGLNLPRTAGVSDVNKNPGTKNLIGALCKLAFTVLQTDNDFC